VNRILQVTLLLAALLATAGCERVFTTSPFTFLQRDPSQYSAAQLVSFAEDALASGDQDSMLAAFELLRGSSDPQTQLLAVDLGLGAVGMEAAITATIAGLAAEGADPETVIGDALAGFTDAELQILVESAALLDAAAESGTPSADQYTLVAVGLIAAAAASEGIENLTSPTPNSDAEAYVTQAGEFLAAAEAILVTENQSTDILSGFDDLIP